MVSFRLSIARLGQPDDRLNGLRSAPSEKYPVCITVMFIDCRRKIAGATTNPAIDLVQSRRPTLTDYETTEYNTTCDLRVRFEF